ncbi:transcriptional regulator [Phenylobacterium hankyongense]|uniref:Transcriptional regulator n=1 Tax=Phenylobacterium hankyongense TaxID=1813876 RepID=A0A328B2I8_9CAUL|nr:helix-turn-helix transcriptional regulator [Phenylobacterium hankyongense]RAK61413.1 transcriptional regulator [Phenylobacterium hankyongense]
MRQTTFDTSSHRAAAVVDNSGAGGPHPIDVHVGVQIRMRRKELRITQEQLAERLGLTFQQIQKYERASNRVSASKLWAIASALTVPIGYFYQGAEDPDSNGLPAAADFMLMPEGLELAATFPKIKARKIRRQILELVGVLGDEARAAG